MIDPHEQTEIPHDLYCQQCGYNLRGLTSSRCPECGESVESLRSQVSQIPWVHRKSIGRFQAYWRTVWWVSFKYKRFCEEISRPVEYRDSQLFRWITIVLAYVPLVVTPIVVAYLLDPRMVRVGQAYAAPTQLLIWASPVVLLVFVIVATGLPSLFFDNRRLPVEVRNRAVAMSYYCCGALAWTPVLGLLWIVGALIFQIGTTAVEAVAVGGMLFAGALNMVQVADWYVNLLRTIRRVNPQDPQRANALAIVLPFLWLLLPGVIVATGALIGGFVFLSLMHIVD